MKNNYGRSWIEYWGRNTLFANEHHMRTHYDRLSEDILALLPVNTVDVLDWGCGPALGTAKFVARGMRLWLFEQAEGQQPDLTRRFAGEKNVRVLSRDDLNALPDRTMDAVLLVGVAPYLTPSQLAELLREIRYLLKPSGRLIIGDVPNKEASLVSDTTALLRAAREHGFLLAALRKLVQTTFSEYTLLRMRAGLTAYSAETMLHLLRDAGFEARVLPRNPGFFPHRLAYEGLAHGKATGI